VAGDRSRPDNTILTSAEGLQLCWTLCCASKELSLSFTALQKKEDEVCETEELTFIPNAAFCMRAFGPILQSPKVLMGTV